MSKFIGRQQSIGIAREITRGTPEVPTFWLSKVNYTIEDKISVARFEGNYGNIAGGDDSFPTHKWAEGDIEFEVGDDSIALILYSLFGTLTSNAFDGVLKHSLALENSTQHQSLTFMVNDPIGANDEASTNTLAYARAVINTFELSVELGELVKVTAGFMSMPHQDFERQAESFSAENKFAHHHLTFKIAANEAGLDAAAKINLQSLTLRINKNAIRENALGTVQPIDILNKKIEISGTIGLLYEDRSYRDYMLDDTQRAVRISLVNKQVTIGATNPQIQFDLPIVFFDEWDPAQELDEIAMQTINFTVLYDVANSQLIGSNTFVVNETSSY